jgi:membrane protein YqaA with SNARE-associated domain
VLEVSEVAIVTPATNASILGNRSLVRWIWIAAGALLAAFMVSMGVAFASGVDLLALIQYGYPGITLIMFFSSATVLLPAPGFASVMAAGTIVNPWIVGPFAGLGSALGELTGYLVGIGSREALEKKRGKWWMRSEAWMRRHGVLTVFLFATIPNPFFDAIGVLAGSLGFSARRMFIACLIGNTLKYTSLALLGNSALGLIRFFG